MQYLNAIDVVCYDNIEERKKYLEVIGGFSVTMEKVLPKEPPLNLTNKDRLERIEKGLELIGIEKMYDLLQDIPMLNIELTNATDEESTPPTINRLDYRSVFLIHFINELNNLIISAHTAIKFISDNYSKSTFFNHINSYLMRIINLRIKAGSYPKRTVKFYKFSTNDCEFIEISIKTLKTIDLAIKNELSSSCGQFKESRDQTITNSKKSLSTRILDSSERVIDETWIEYLVTTVIEMNYYSKTAKSKRIFSIDLSDHMTKDLSLSIPNEFATAVHYFLDPIEDNYSDIDI
jgi:hypothetical protein